MLGRLRRTTFSAPTTFRDGFTLRTVMGAFFVGFIMMPGAIYMGLIAGVSLGSAAEWVTIILFSELARRSFSSLTRQEIYVTYYIAGDAWNTSPVPRACFGP